MDHAPIIRQNGSQKSLSRLALLRKYTTKAGAPKNEMDRQAIYNAGSFRLKAVAAEYISTGRPLKQSRPNVLFLSSKKVEREAMKNIAASWSAPDSMAIINPRGKEGVPV